MCSTTCNKPSAENFITVSGLSDTSICGAHLWVTSGNSDRSPKHTLMCSFTTLPAPTCQGRNLWWRNGENQQPDCIPPRSSQNTYLKAEDKYVLRATPSLSQWPDILVIIQSASHRSFSIHFSKQQEIGENHSCTIYEQFKLAICLKVLKFKLWSFVASPYEFKHSSSKSLLFPNKLWLKHWEGN